MLFMKNILATALLLGSSTSSHPIDRSVFEAIEGVRVDWTAQKTSAIQAIAGPSPAEYQKAIDENRSILRAQLLLKDSTIVELFGHPKEIDFYDSTVVISRKGQPIRSYNIGELTKHQALTLAHVAIVPAVDGNSVLILEYEGGFIGAKEGFAVLRFDSGDVYLNTLPLADFGKVVISKRNPDQAIVWSALPYPRGTDAEPMFYSSQVCRWQKSGYECAAPKKQRGRFSPASINDPGIEIRP